MSYYHFFPQLNSNLYKPNIGLNGGKFEFIAANIESAAALRYIFCSYRLHLEALKGPLPGAWQLWPSPCCFVSS